MGNTPQTGCYASATCAACTAPTNAMATCSAQGTCEFQCNPGYTLSGGACTCSSGCCSDSDCGSGETCQSGTCTPGAGSCNELLCMFSCLGFGMCNNGVCECF
jgi:hypothetical protein